MYKSQIFSKQTPANLEINRINPNVLVTLSQINDRSLPLPCQDILDQLGGSPHFDLAIPEETVKTILDTQYQHFKKELKINPEFFWVDFLVLSRVGGEIFLLQVGWEKDFQSNVLIKIKDLSVPLDKEERQHVLVTSALL